MDHTVVDRFGKAQFCSQLFAENDGESLELKDQAFVGLDIFGRIAAKDMPDLHEQLPGYGRHRDVAVPFAGEEFPTPLAQCRVAPHPQYGMSSLHEKVPDIASPPLADSYLDAFTPPALSSSGIESSVGDELGGIIEAPHVTDGRQQRERVDQPDSEHLHAAKHERFGTDLAGNEPEATFPPLGLVIEVGEFGFKDLGLQGCPLTLTQDPLARLGLRQSTLAGADSELVEVTLEGVDRRSMGGDGIVVEVEQLAAFPGHRIGHPDAGRVAGEVD